jgi:hypothetical protein
MAVSSALTLRQMGSNMAQPEKNGCVCQFQAADGIGNIGTWSTGIRDVEAVEMPAPQVMKRLRAVRVGTVRDHDTPASSWGTAQFLFGTCYVGGAMEQAYRAI